MHWIPGSFPRELKWLGHVLSSGGQSRAPALCPAQVYPWLIPQVLFGCGRMEAETACNLIPTEEKFPGWAGPGLGQET